MCGRTGYKLGFKAGFNAGNKAADNAGDKARHMPLKACYSTGQRAPGQGV